MTTVRARRAGVVLLVSVASLLVLAAPALGHPLGNFTSNTAVRAVVGTDGIDLRYVLDLAEIPTTRYRQEVDRDDDGELTPREVDAAAADRCAGLLADLAVQVDGTRVEVRAATHDLAFPEGQAGLPTTRLACDARVDAGTEQAEITIVDSNLPDRIGWREVTAVGDRVRLVDADVPEASPTRLLREYPEQAISDPLRTTSASLRTRPGGAPAAVDALEGGDGAGGAGGSGGDEVGVFERLSLAYTDLVAERELTLGFGLFAMVLAMLLGTLHALAPGHGKTVIAAYVVGQRGTARQALGIGVMVAVTHTVGVLLLGLLLSTSEALVPERIYPWLGVLSGAIVVWIGVGLVRGALRRRALARARAHDHAHAHAQGHAHDHGQDHDHDHGHDHGHGHGHGGHHHHHPELGEVDLGWRNLVALGVAGGMAPSPSALLVLLGAAALGRAWFGVVLVIAYGVGLAGLLVIGGLLLVRVRGAAERLIQVSERPRLQRLTAALPMLTGVAVVLGGLVIAARGFVL